MSVREVRFLAVVSLGLVAIVTVLCSRNVSFRGHTGDVCTVVASPDGMMLASSSKEDKTVRLWDVSTRKVRILLAGFSGLLRFSPDGKTLATSGRDNAIHLWDIANGEELATLTVSSESVCDVAFSPDGNVLALGCSDGTVKLFELPCGTEIRSFPGQAGRISSVAFSSDGKTVASVNSEKTIHISDITTGKERAELMERNEWVQLVAFSPDGKILVAVNCIYAHATLWDINERKSRKIEYPRWFRELDEPYMGCVAFSPDGETLALRVDEVIGLWDVASGKHTAKFRCDRRVPGLTVNSLYDCLRTFQTNGKYVDSLFFTPEGKLMALRKEKHTITLWEVAGAPITGYGFRCGLAVGLLFFPMAVCAHGAFGPIARRAFPFQAAHVRIRPRFDRKTTRALRAIQWGICVAFLLVVVLVLLKWQH
jgi:WD40 repeat protein